MDEVIIRDFIYLDTDTLGSIISQLEKGLIKDLIEEKGDQKEITGELKAAIFGIGGKGTAGYLKKDVETETKILHDYIYDRVKDKLEKANKVVSIDKKQKDILQNWKDGKLNNSINETAFVLINAQIILDDYVNFQEIAEKFNEIGNAMGYLSAGNVQPPHNLTKKEKKKWEREKEEKIKETMKLDPKMLKSILTVIKQFFRNKLVVKVTPFPEEPYFRFVGDIKEDYLRDPIESIVLKYGTAPTSKWHIFGRISSILPKNYEKTDSKPNDLFLNIDEEIKSNLQMEIPMDEVFNALRGVDQFFSPKFPYVTFTPIAIYREG